MICLQCNKECKLELEILSRNPKRAVFPYEFVIEHINCNKIESNYLFNDERYLE